MSGRLLRIVAAICLTWGTAGCRGSVADGSSATEGKNMLAIVGARIYTSPAEAPLSDGTLIMADGAISAAGRRDRISVPAGAAILNAELLYRKGLIG